MRAWFVFSNKLVDSCSTNTGDRALAGLSTRIYCTSISMNKFRASFLSPSFAVTELNCSITLIKKL